METGNQFGKNSKVEADLFELGNSNDRQVTPWRPPGKRWDFQADMLRQEWENLRNRFSKGFGGSIQVNGKKWRIPWTKLILLGLAVYVLTFKDLQFSLDMKAPLAPGAVGAPPASSSPVNQSSSPGTFAPPTQEQDEDIEAYIDRFQKVALAEMKKFGIPASIKMAQGILESQAGRSQDCRQSNNHFGSPMAGQIFNSAWANWRAHSELLRQDYPELFRNGSNYKSWAEGLERAGYNPRKGYARQLIRIIDTYRLSDWDKE